MTKKTIKYFGEKAIEKMVGNILFFEDKTEKVLSDKQMEYLVTDEPKDATQTRDLVLDNVIPDIMQILIQHNVKKGDIQSIVNGILASYNQTFLTAVWKAFGTYEEWKPVESYPENISIIDIERLIK